MTAIQCEELGWSLPTYKHKEGVNVVRVVSHHSDVVLHQMVFNAGPSC